MVGRGRSDAIRSRRARFLGDSAHVVDGGFVVLLDKVVGEGRV